MTKNVIGLLALCGLTAAASGQVVISQVYGGGGNSGAAFNRDFVELKNNGAAPADISNWSIQYASTTGAFGTANSKVDIPAGSIIAPGAYFLVALSQGANGALPALPTPDYDAPSAAPGTIFVGSTGGKVALVNSTTAVATVSCPTDASIVDFVGWGTGINCFEGTGAAATTNPVGLRRQSNGCQDTNINSADFSIVAPTPRNSATSPVSCSFLDCNNNGIPDSTDIANNTSQDCNTNQVPDECEMAAGDCNGNGQLDECEIDANPALDCNANNRLDSCDIAAGILTDADGNAIADSCEGAAVTECNINATVTPAGIRATTSGNDFFNVEGGSLGVNASYGAARWDISAAVARFNTDFGAGQWAIAKAYLYMQQSNAAFTVDSLPDAIEIMHSNLDTIDITPQATVTGIQFPNFVTDWTDAQYIRSYTFTRGTVPAGGNGTIESYQLFDIGGTNNAGMTAVAADLDTATGQITLLIKANDAIDPFCAATYAGRTNSTWRGPTLVLWAQATGPSCDGDVNCDFALDGFDVEVQEKAVGGDVTDYCQADPDFNGDFALDGFDVEAVEVVVGGGPCP